MPLFGPFSTEKIFHVSARAPRRALPAASAGAEKNMIGMRFFKSGSVNSPKIIFSHKKPPIDLYFFQKMIYCK
jgi:hypothetical protein